MHNGRWAVICGLGAVLCFVLVGLVYSMGSRDSLLWKAAGVMAVILLADGGLMLMVLTWAHADIWYEKRRRQRRCWR